MLEQSGTQLSSPLLSTWQSETLHSSKRFQRYRSRQISGILSEVAVGEILGLLSWGGFSLQSQRSKSSSLNALIEGEEGLDPRITIKENVIQGACPQFQSQGFLSPDSITLIEDGKHASSLISPEIFT